MFKRVLLPFLLLLLLLGGIGFFFWPQLSRYWEEPPPTVPDSLLTALFAQLEPPPPDPNRIHFAHQGDSVHLELINPTFLNNEKRNYYGNQAPERLDVLWTHELGTGRTAIGSKMAQWSGAGWTGQPLLVRENDSLFIIQGAYDHHLKKINAHTGQLVWQYRFDDVLKGTGSIWINHSADSLHQRCVILQGSRAGTRLSTKVIPSFRAVSYFTGEEMWRLNVTRTRSYSRDVDASALLLKDTAYIGLENGIFTILNPDNRFGQLKEGIFQPQIFKNSDTLYAKSDSRVHGGNLVLEASPSRLGKRIYLATGAGHIYGYNLETQEVDWDFFTGSDIDGSPIVTADSCLLISVEKQYIRGRGGVLKLDPSKSPEEAIVWFFPTKNRYFSGWKGGIIGSVGINDAYREASAPSLACFTGIDGWLYVVQNDSILPDTTIVGFDGKTALPTTRLLFKYETGPSISTPVFVNNRIVNLTYDGLYLFEHDANYQFRLLDNDPAIRGEATPFVHEGRIYVASRNGNLYCLGEGDVEK